jgi:tetratricopeptide (TPR) repeat protein
MKFLSFLFLLLSINMMAQTNFEKGLDLMGKKKYQEAKPYIELAIKENPKNYKALDLYGEISMYEKNWDEAIKSAKKLVEVFPKNANYWYQYGGAMGLKAKSINKFKALSMIDGIEKAFLKSAALDSQHIGTRWALVMLYIELPAIVGGSETKAKKYAEELQEISKVDGYLAKGYIDEYFSRYTKAEANYIKAHEIGNSKTTFQKLYNLYLNKIKDKTKAKKLKEQFEKK